MFLSSSQISVIAMGVSFLFAKSAIIIPPFSVDYPYVESWIIPWIAIIAHLKEAIKQIITSKHYAAQNNTLKYC